MRLPTQTVTLPRECGPDSSLTALDARGHDAGGVQAAGMTPDGQRKQYERRTVSQS